MDITLLLQLVHALRNTAINFVGNFSAWKGANGIGICFTCRQERDLCGTTGVRVYRICKHCREKTLLNNDRTWEKRFLDEYPAAIATIRTRAHRGMALGVIMKIVRLTDYISFGDCRVCATPNIPTTVAYTVASTSHLMCNDCNIQIHAQQREISVAMTLIRHIITANLCKDVSDNLMRLVWHCHVELS